MHHSISGLTAAHAILCIATITASFAACDDLDSPDGAERDGTFSAGIDADSCDGLFREEDLVIAERRVHRRVCYHAGERPLPASESYAFVDDDGRTGPAFSFEELRRYEGEHLASPDGKIVASLRSQRDADPTALLDVDLWFRFDQPPIADKARLLASDELLSAHKAAYANALSRGRGAIEAEVARAGLRVQLLQTERTVAPRLPVRVPAGSLDALAAIPGVTAITESLERELATEIPYSEVFMDVDRIPYLKSHGWDGTGITVANAEGALPNSIVNLSLPSGSCSPGYVCLCPDDEANYHPHAVIGIIRNTVASLRGGAAADSRDIFVNCEAGTFYEGQDATVINRSAGPAQDANPQSGANMYYDVLPIQPPFPLVVMAAGNKGPTMTSGNKIRNGLVVGGANDQGNPDRNALKTMYSGSQGANDGGASGWELPHIVAPAVMISTPGDDPDEVVTRSGTSFAAPQVSGIGASLQEQTGLKIYPEALIPALLVGPEQGVHGVWPLDLHDSIDDLDGVGSVNAELSSRVLAHKVNGNQRPSALGFDHGQVWASSTPAQSYFPEKYNVTVPAGRTLRVAAVVLSQPTCGAQAATTNCGANPYPRFWLGVVRTGLFTLPVAVSDNLNQNYQYLSVPPQSQDVTYEISLYMRDWSGIATTWYGVAFTSEA